MWLPGFELPTAQLRESGQDRDARDPGETQLVAAARWVVTASTWSGRISGPNAPTCLLFARLRTSYTLSS